MAEESEKYVTQEETGEPAAIDQIEGRVEAEMKVIEGRAKERVAHGLQDEGLERDAKQLKREGERELREQREE